ncbi:GNAT family N-acetyltransferase [Candidatus Magnetominusculus dajiuhuensis]|uniref:GNAT family N-acetyltransferase n=1 Tax=Candidatus Magnetominusculus dajiuhuensis TaxID=3137712 RepID=UPI003B4348FC
MKGQSITLRTSAMHSDIAPVRQILDSTGVFHQREIAVAIELLDDNLTKLDQSEYKFIFADVGGRAVGYICYGPITMTEAGYDIYWIAVRKDMQGRGVAGLLIDEAQRRIIETGGKFVYIETSAKEQYSPAREFYLTHGYVCVATVPHYYAEGDDKAVFMKIIR